MIFMVLVGGIGRFEGAILGAMHLLPDRDVVRRRRRLVSGRARRHGACSSRCCCRAACGAPSKRASDLRLLPVGYRLVLSPSAADARTPTPSPTSNREGRKRMTMLLGKTILITGVASGIGARTAELAGQLGADVIGVDMREPATLRRHLRQGRHLDQGRRRRAGRATAQPLRRALQCRRPLRQDRRRVDARRQFLRAARAFRSDGAKDSARAAPSSTSPRSPASAGAPISTARPRWSASRAFPMSPEVIADHDVKNEEGYPVSKELLLLWTFRAAHQALFKEPRHPRQCGQPRPGRDADPDAVPRGARRRPRRQRHRARRPRRHRRRHRAGRAVPVLGRRALDQRRQHRRSMAGSKHRSTPRFSVSRYVRRRCRPTMRGRLSWISDF